MNIILVEDNTDLCEDLCFQLSRSGHEIDVAGDARAMDELMVDKKYNIAILDIGLPGEDGLSIASRLRLQQPNLGIILLTARSEINTKVHGLTVGADSYLVKPVDWRELVAVIESLQRRIHVPILMQDKWQLTQAGRELIKPTGIRIPLTAMEGMVVTILAQHAGNPVSRNDIIAYLVGHDFLEFDPRRLEVCISRLKQKIILTFDHESKAELTNENSPIKSVRSVGYIFTQSILIQ